MSGSSYAITPETHAAWRYLELDDEHRPYDQERAEILRGNAELDLLLADLEKSPTIEKIEQVFKRGLEHKCFTQRSLARSLERYRCQNICIADVEARPGAYPCFGTEEENRRRVEEVRKKDVALAQVAAEVEEGQRQRPDTERKLVALEAFMIKRHSCEQGDESEPSISRG